MVCRCGNSSWPCMMVCLHINMTTLQIIGKVVRTTGIWALLWGLTGAAAGAILTLIDPDTGHIPRAMVPLMIGVSSAVLGALAGLLFALIVVPAGIRIPLGTTGRTLLGATVGGIVGIVFMNILAHSIVTIALASLLGAALGARFTRPASLAASK